jgi:hypothetical protein
VSVCLGAMKEVPLFLNTLHFMHRPRTVSRIGSERRCPVAYVLSDRLRHSIVFERQANGKQEQFADNDGAASPSGRAHPSYGSWSNALRCVCGCLLRSMCCWHLRHWHCTLCSPMSSDLRTIARHSNNIVFLHPDRINHRSIYQTFY